MPVARLGEAHPFGDVALERLDLLLVKFEDAAAVQADDMIVVPLVERFVHDPPLRIDQGLTQDLGITEDLDVPVDGGSPDIRVLLGDPLDDLLSAQVIRRRKNELGELPPLLTVLQARRLEIAPELCLPTLETSR